jgi:hypothetical protein
MLHAKGRVDTAFQKSRSGYSTTGRFCDEHSCWLRALLAIASVTASIKVLPVIGKHLGISMNYQGDEYKIDERCFDHAATHQDTYCEGSSNKSDGSGYVFTCDHAIEDIYETLLNDMRASKPGMLTPEIRRRLATMARVKVQQMPRAVMIRTNNNRTTLYVSWTSVQPHNRTEEPMRVTMHSTKCTLQSVLQLRIGRSSFSTTPRPVSTLCLP